MSPPAHIVAAFVVAGTGAVVAAGDGEAGRVAPCPNCRAQQGFHCRPIDWGTLVLAAVESVGGRPAEVAAPLVATTYILRGYHCQSHH